MKRYVAVSLRASNVTSATSGHCAMHARIGFACNGARHDLKCRRAVACPQWPSSRTRHASKTMPRNARCGGASKAAPSTSAAVAQRQQAFTACAACHSPAPGSNGVGPTLLQRGHEAQIPRFERKRLHEFANECCVGNFDRATVHDRSHAHRGFNAFVEDDAFGAARCHWRVPLSMLVQRDVTDDSTTSNGDARSKSLGMRRVASAVTVRLTNARASKDRHT